ncbi:hypothetical protein ACNKHO_19050 [Shigella flexneri]
MSFGARTQPLCDRTIVTGSDGSMSWSFIAFASSRSCSGERRLSPRLRVGLQLFLQQGAHFAFGRQNRLQPIALFSKSFC